MALFSKQDRRFAESIADLTYCNPFLPERLEFEREALGADFVEAPNVWSLQPDVPGERPNIGRLLERAEPVVRRLHARLASGTTTASARDLALHGDLVLYVLFQRYRDDFQETLTTAAHRPTGRIDYWRRFKADFDRLMCPSGSTITTTVDPAHIFACFYQIRRAFHHVFGAIVGGSMPAARLRAAVWQSVFTYDMRRYSRVLYRHMVDMTTLVTGPSGTGKELVARAIAQSRYIPFDPETQRFAGDASAAFFPLNLSALSPTLIESELFGHKRGSFTGAVGDRAGWLEVCPSLGAVFLDEIGELDPAIQVKLLRLLQTRTFQRLGETEDRTFEGKIVAATNRDVATELAEGRFREDFYYRLCSDIITTPSLSEQLADRPDDLGSLVSFIARRIVAEEAETLAPEVVQWIETHLGHDYPWPGNIRELEQCVRNVLIRRSYQPPTPRSPSHAETLTEDLRQGDLTADELLRRYCTMVYARCGSYEEAARRLALDRRTVKAKVDTELLEQIKTGR